MTMGNNADIVHASAVRSDAGAWPQALQSGNQLSTAVGTELGQPAPAVANFNLGKFLHGILRGRYRLVITLGIITGAIAGAAGWRFARPIYHSEGLVRISYSLPEVIAETDQNKPLGFMFDPFIQSQKMLISSRRAIDLAIQDPTWKALGRAVPPNPDRYYAENLTVETKSRSEFIRIVVTDYDPVTAAAATTAIVNAYSDVYRQREDYLQRQRYGALQDLQGPLQAKIEQLTKDIATASQEYGTTNLEPFYVSAVDQANKLEYALADVRNAMATAPPSVRGSGGTADKSVNGFNLTSEQIGVLDPTMRSYIDQQERLEEDLAQLKVKGYGDAYASVQTAKHAVEAAKKRVAKYAEFYRQFHDVTTQNLGDPRTSPIPTAGKSLEMLRANKASLEKLLAEAKEDMITIGNKRLALQRMEADLQARKLELTKLTGRLDTLKTEATLGGRLNVFSTGEIPLSPDRDPRIRLAMGAGFGGGLLPLCGIVFMSLVTRKYRFSDDTKADGARTKIPLLGILPELHETRFDREDTLAAAHSIHQVRVSLQARANSEGAKTYLVTSATAGEGKTSLTLSLGLSFAVSKQRTLVIDCDLVGRHLTSNLGAQDSEGLQEALAAGSMRKLLRKTDTGLYVLTTGRAESQDAYALPAAKMKALLREAKNCFDIVLIDTGPILGSVEAAVLAQQVDGVILTITRGQERRLVEQAMARLSSLGVKIAGMIFNRARPQDFHQSAYSSSHRSIMSTPAARTSSRSDQQALTGFGPLVQAVDSPKGDN